MSRGREQSCSRTREEGEEQDEDFYDCQETLEPPEPRGGGQGKEEKEIQQDFHIKDRQTEEADTERETGGGQQEEEQGGELNEEEEMKKEVSAPVESNEEYLTEVEKEEGSPPVEFEEEYLTEVEKEDLKEEVSPPVEFDDEYLKEVEKELTEEEKERRRQQSLSLKEAGNALFKKGEWSEAGCSYTEALSVCPVSFSKERAVLFSNRAAARMHQDLKEAAISDCSRAIDLDPDYLRALLRRAELYEQTEKLDEALEDYQKVLERDPNNTSARCAVMRLPQQIQERNEKLKEEMISKLKDLGNMVLRPFGLSTSNFQVNQDAASGSYSINFVQNPNNNNR